MKTSGLDELKNKLRSISDKSEQTLSNVTEATARTVERDAKVNAPTDYGKLKQSVNALPVTDNVWKVSTNVPYAPFVEFGTGAMVAIPEGWEDVAIEYKGKGIKQVNLHPRPYLIPAFDKGKKDYVKQLKTEIKAILND